MKKNDYEYIGGIFLGLFGSQIGYRTDILGYIGMGMCVAAVFAGYVSGRTYPQ